MYTNQFVDIHTHTEYSAANVIVVRNLSLSEAEKINISDNDFYFSAGVHPWDIGKIEKDWESRLETICRNDSAVLVGECGLDKNIDESFEIQAEIFKKHIQLSEKLKKPLIIHCVGYFNELMDLKKQSNPEQMWIVHGFRGKPQLAEQLLKAGFYLSFGEKFNSESVKVTPIERVFVETDESQKPIEEIYSDIMKIKNSFPLPYSTEERGMQNVTAASHFLKTYIK